MIYSIKKLADLAGVSVRTLHYYDEQGLLKPQSRNRNGYRYYDDKTVMQLQQIMFFRELGFSLKEVKKIIFRKDFDVLEALQTQRTLLTKQVERNNELITTVDKTIQKLKGEVEMQIKEYYQGFSDEQIEKYRQEVRQRWGETTLRESEKRIIKMGKERFTALQAEGGKIFQTISDNMSRGYDNKIVQEQVAHWRQWLENFHHYSEDEVRGLGGEYSRNPEFAKFFQKIHPELPDFLTKAIEYYCAHKESPQLSRG
jgi:MerR family transcriptional regulator, thiopeptide resistance regulator